MDPTKPFFLLLLSLCPFAPLSLCPSAHAQQPAALNWDDPRFALQLPSELRQWYRNPDGSCVQCSIGMCGVDQDVPAAYTLLWDTEFGPRVRGGSGPDRVATYCDRRGIKAWNITGRQTYDWMRWACKNGRGCAIGAGTMHFQTLVGHDPSTNTWWVCNNNSPTVIDQYTEAGFHRLHEASGTWIVILDAPPHPRPAKYVAWWE